MAEDIKSLIEKIHREGIQAAEAKAQEIEAQAAKSAQQIISQAKKEAEKLFAQAQSQVTQLKAKEQATLEQAARDTLLMIKGEINAMLQKLIFLSVRQALSRELLVKLITSLVGQAREKGIVDIEVLMSKDDAAQLEREILGQLGNEAKKGLVLKPSHEIGSGFCISFDQGKSQFDFTEQSLAEYIGDYLKPKLAKLLSQAAST